MSQILNYQYHKEISLLIFEKNLASCLKMERFNGPTVVQSLFSLKMFKCLFILMSILKHTLDIV